MLCGIFRIWPVNLVLVVFCPSIHAILTLDYGESVHVHVTLLVMFHLFRGIYFVCDHMIIDDFIFNIQTEW